MYSANLQTTRTVGHIEVTVDQYGLASSLRLTGRPLFLVPDRAAIRAQVEGSFPDPLPTPDQLYAHVSTDAIIKANPDCYYYDARLGDRLLRSLRGGGLVLQGEIQQGGFGLVLAGEGWGEGSSREVAALALLYAGVGAVFAPAIAPIHRQNLINNGMFPLTDYSLALRLAVGHPIQVDEVTRGFDGLSERILRRGGLFPFMEARLRGEETDSPIQTPPRPMNIAERIFAAHMHTSSGAVAPGDSGFVRVDVGFSHDYTTAPAAAQVQAALGRPPRVKSPERIHAFPDHLTLAPELGGMTAEALDGIRDLREVQQKVAHETGMVFHRTATGGSTGICHTVIRERIALPGQIVLGTDSHTCSAGALNCLAYGIGNSEIASIWEYDEVVGKVPQSVRVTLTGRLRSGCTAKDAVLELARLNKEMGIFTGRVMEFGGEGLATLSLEEQAVLANMSAECNALTAIMEPTRSLEEYLVRKRGLMASELGTLWVVPDPGAHYEQQIGLDLSALEPMVARPGHPGNGVPLSLVRGTPIDIAYAGSCTAGDIESIGMYALVLEGRRVQVPTFIQYGSVSVRDEATRRGWHSLLEAAGVTVISEPGCGACINAGPGGPQAGQVAISATNRNMPGRMGDGDAYLANPLIVAASAVRGAICGPEDL